MRKFLLLLCTWCVAFVAHAQEMPYSKYLNFSKEQFKELCIEYFSKILDE